jgi:hypothetical protein
LCVFDDVVQFTGAHSHRYSQFFLSRMAESLADESAEVKFSFFLLIFLSPKSFFQDSSSCCLWFWCYGNEWWSSLCPCMC